MIKTINVAGKPVVFKATASTLARYRDTFGSDLMDDYRKVTKEAEPDSSALTIAFQIAYTMAKQGDPSIPDDMWDWLDDFEVFPVNEVLPEIIALWSSSLGTKAEIKNA